MKAVLLFVAFVALFASASPLSCDNPFFRLITDKSWDFPYLTQSAIQGAQNQVCQGYNGQQSCCDDTVFNNLEKAWTAVRTEVIAVRVELAVLQAGVDALLVEIAVLKAAVQASANFTADDKADIITFLDGVAAAVAPLVPAILDGFVPCYSSVLKFYAGLLCRLCDPVWDDWVLLEGSNPATDNFRLNFSQATCNGFTEACSPFFTPFYNFRDALLAAFAQLARNVNNATFQDITDGINDYQPPCDSADDCLQFICYKFLSGLDRDEEWITDTFNSSSSATRRDNSGSIASRFVRSLNAVQRSARQVTKRASDLSGTDYSGTFDPLTQQTTLNTDASTSPSSRLSPFWLSFFGFFL